MAPLRASFFSIFPRRIFDAGVPSQEFLDQWTHPSDVFSVLLILGGDVIARALAQLAGTGLTPVTFSFGWVAYAITAVVSAVGENRLMPQPDCACKVINGKTAYVRDNTSWVLGRIMRDYETWMHEDVRKCVETLRNDRWALIKKAAKEKDPKSEAHIPRPAQAGLVVSFYRAGPAQAGRQQWDLAYASGFIVVILQLGIAATPCGLWGDWSILLVTAAGTVLAFVSGWFPQWRKEKWACRKLEKPKTVLLTRGNGAQHAIVIRDPDAVGFDLESLAGGQANVDVSASLLARIGVVGVAVLWTLLLITSSGIHDNTWFLLAVGGLGIVHAITIAGLPRMPAAFGIPLIYDNKVIGNQSVMKTLYDVEDLYTGVGLSLLGTFFPGRLFPDEEEKWNEYKKKAYTQKSKLDKHTPDGVTSAKCAPSKVVASSSDGS